MAALNLERSRSNNVRRSGVTVFDLLRRQAILSHSALVEYRAVNAGTSEDGPVAQFLSLATEAATLRMEVEARLSRSVSLSMDREDLDRLSAGLDGVFDKIAHGTRQLSVLVPTESTGSIERIGAVLFACTTASTSAIEAIGKGNFVAAGDDARTLRVLTRDARLTFEEALAALLAADLDPVRLMGEALALSDAHGITTRYGSLGRLIAHCVVKYT